MKKAQVPALYHQTFDKTRKNIESPSAELEKEDIVEPPHFMPTIMVSALPVIKLATDPCMPAQYDGLVTEAAKTAAASKGKQQ
ncbi:hypothetical protein C0993_008880, partial [Termitomyces sp. T159_Od127]